MGICISKRERNRLVYSAHESADEAALVESARVFARAGSDYATRSVASQLELTVQFFEESEGEIRLIDSSGSQENRMTGVMPSIMTGNSDEIGVFNAQKYFKANDQQRAHEYEVGLATNDMHWARSPTAAPGNSEIQDDYHFRNPSTAASSDVGYDSRSGLSGSARKAASLDAAMWSSSPCNSRNNNCNNRIKDSNYTVHTLSSCKACRCSFCTGKSAADAMDEPSFAKSAGPKRRSVKAVQDSIYSPPTTAPITCKVGMAQSLPTGAYTAAPIMTKLELPKSSQQGKHSAQNIMNELPQPLSPPASAKQTSLFCTTVETGKPKSLDHTSTLSARPCLTSLQILPSTFLSMVGTPGPMCRVQSSDEHEQSLGSGDLRLGQDQMLSLPVLQSTNAGRFEEDSSDGYIKNATHSSMGIFRQQTSATTQGHLDHTWRPSVRNLTEWQVPMLGSIAGAPLPYLEADAAASSITGAGQQIMAQVVPGMLTSVPHFEMGLSAWNKDPGILQRTSKNADISQECNHFGESVSSIHSKPWHAENEAAVTREDLHQRTIGKGEDIWEGTENMDELEVIGHISNTSMQVMGGKKHALHEIDSDSSSDLFDLESLVGCGDGADHGL